MKCWYLVISCMFLSCSDASVAPVEVLPSPEIVPQPALAEETEPKAKWIETKFTQVDRGQRRERFDLDPANQLSDTLIKGGINEIRGKIDILIVVDNSGSMQEEQDNLATKVAPLLQEIEKQDWRINIISTDSPCSTISSLPFDSTTPNLMSEFEDAISIGTNGSGEEKAIEVAYTHLLGQDEDESCNASSWMRPKAGFSMIILSDEDEDKSTKVGPGKFIQALGQFGFEPGFNARVFGIISIPERPCPTAMQPGKIYYDLISRTGGFAGDICAEDYTETLELISVSLSSLILSEMKLQKVPDPSTIKVTVNEQVLDETYWRNAGDSIVFAYIFSPGDTIKVDYRTKVERSFLLKEAPSEVIVKVDGKTIDQETFKVVKENLLEGTNYILHVPNLPPESRSIELDYKLDTKLNERFYFPEYAGGAMICSLNGKEIKFTYLDGSESITFDPTPKDGETVLCKHEVVGRDPV